MAVHGAYHIKERKTRILLGIGRVSEHTLWADLPDFIRMISAVIVSLFFCLRAFLRNRIYDFLCYRKPLETIGDSSGFAHAGSD